MSKPFDVTQTRWYKWIQGNPNWCNSGKHLVLSWIRKSGFKTLCEAWRACNELSWMEELFRAIAFRGMNPESERFLSPKTGRLILTERAKKLRRAGYPYGHGTPADKPAFLRKFIPNPPRMRKGYR